MSRRGRSRATQIRCTVPVIPPRVVAGMFLAAWARAEHCPVDVLAGRRLELHVRYTPSPALERAFASWHARADLVGCLGWAIPLMRDRKTRRVYAATWPLLSEHGRH